MMKRLILSLIFIFTFTTCGLNKQIANNWETINSKGSLIEIYDKVIDSTEFVMVCNCDTVSANLDEWFKMWYRTYNGDIVEQWLFIKDTDTNTVYILTKQTDSTYNLNIRKIVE